MSIPSFLVNSEVYPNRLVRGMVVDVDVEGIVRVAYVAEELDPVPCIVLQTSDGPGLRLESGEAVLVWIPPAEDQPGVILGRLVTGRSPAPRPEGPPDELVLEARQGLILRCGDGSITLRGDGKILIKGKDLVSRAERMNRIKGGAVAIN